MSGLTIYKGEILPCWARQVVENRLCYGCWQVLNAGRRANYGDGVDVWLFPPYQRPINMMFQSYALFPHMTVEATFGLKQGQTAEGGDYQPRQ